MHQIKTVWAEEEALNAQRGESTITRYVEREVLNHSLMLHPHIIQFKEVFLTQKYLAIAMEYADGGDMFQHVKNRRGLHEFEVPFSGLAILEKLQRAEGILKIA